MIVTVAHKDTGAVMKVGDDGGPDFLAINSITSLLAAGHSRIESKRPSALHRWGGAEWVVDPVLATEAKAVEWRIEMRRLDAELTNDVRYWEELALGALSPAAVARMAAIIARRVAHRAVRPNGT